MHDTLISAPGGPRAVRLRGDQTLAPGAGAALLHDGFRLVGLATDVPLLEGRRAIVDGRELSVFRLPDRYVAVGAVCPYEHHRHEAGRVGGQRARCPDHGWQVDLTTGVLGIGTQLVPLHDAIERDGLLYVRRTAREPAT